MRSEHKYGFAGLCCGLGLLLCFCGFLYLLFSLSQELGDELKAKSAMVNELRKRRLTDDEEHTEKSFISRINTISQALTASAEQVRT